MVLEATYAPGPPYPFKRRFLCLSLLVIAVVTIASSILLSRFLGTRLLMQDAESMRAFVHSIVKVEKASSYFLRQQEMDGNIVDFFNHIGSMPDVARANVYAKDRRLLWSSNPRIIGERFNFNPELEHALAGNLFIKSGMVGDHDKPEHVGLGNSHLQFVEIYIPVVQEETGDIVGAIEVYRLPNALFATIAQGQRIIWMSAFAAGAFLLATLFGLVQRADQVIRSQQGRLVETETLAALGEFASAVAHGIRNPLAAIRSSAELWHDDAGQPGVQESAHDIMSEVDRLEKWVRELLMYSQPLENQMATVDLPPIIQESVTGFARESERREVSITLRVNERLPRIAGEPALLMQAFNNVIANALDATQPGGEIIVSASGAPDQKHVELAFTDNGAGIAPERMAKVGSPFYTTKQKGLGVGLAMVRRIVKHTGGRVVIVSRQGVGTTVTLFSSAGTLIMPYAVLIIEDEPIVAKNIKAYLSRYGYESMLAFSGEEGLAAMDNFQPGVILLDYNLPNMNGLQVLEQVRKRDPSVMIIMITGHGSTEVAVQAMKAGAYDYLAKPLILCELKLLLDKAIERDRLEKSYGYLREKEARQHGLNQLVGESPPMAALKENLRRLIAAEYSLTDNDPPSVLITGETGTGKELVARALHFDGQRRSQPFIEINCAAVPAHLLEAELFGYERGAFTDAKARKPGLLEAAEGGTLFLDEIGEVDLSFQSKLLKVLEEKKLRRLGGLREIPVNFRVIAATNQNIEHRVQDGKFRSDLYFRLRMMPLHVPPLRERGQDVILLARCFLKLHGARYRKPGLFLTPCAELALLNWPWPGNVRELRNTLEHVALMAQENAINENQLATITSTVGLCMEAKPPAFAVSQPMQDNLPANGLNLEKLERECLVRALQNTAWNVTQAAKLLGLSRDTLRYRMEKYGLKNMQ